MIGLDRLREIVQDCQWLSVDYESTDKIPHLCDSMGFAVVTDKGGGYLPWDDGFREDTDGLPFEEYTEQLRQILAPVVEKVPVLGFNLGFDLHFLFRGTRTEVQTPIDVRVGLWLLNEVGDLGLKGNFSAISGLDWPGFSQVKKLAYEQLVESIKAMRAAHVAGAVRGQIGKARSEAVQLFPIPQTISNREIPLSILAPYCVKDALFTAALWFGYVRPGLEAEGLLDYFYAYEVPFTRVLWRMSHRGVLVDRGRLQTLADTTLAEVVDLKAQIAERLGRDDINLNSPQQMTQLLFGELGYEPSGRLTDGGKARQRAGEEVRLQDQALDEEALKLLEEKYHEQTDLFRLLLDYKKQKKRAENFSTTLPKLLDSRDYAHPDADQCGTATGRLSCSEPNVQQIEKGEETRGVFVAPPGYVFLDADLSQAEYRILADRSRDPVLTEAYLNGRDMHDETAAKFGIKRKLAKVVNFGISYGMGPPALREALGFMTGEWFSVDQAKNFISGWYERYAAVTPWKEQVVAECRAKGYVRTRLGRRRHLFELQDPNTPFGQRAAAERQAVNCEIQGDVADWMKIAMIRVDAFLLGLGGLLVMQVHDEVCAYVPEARALEAARGVARILADSFQGTAVPMLAEVSLGPDWGHTEEVPLEELKAA